jgi:aspartate aminotransferase-like enzyme
MAGKGWTMDKGYGNLKGKTFRVAHMADMQPSELEEILAGVDEFAGA